MHSLDAIARTAYSYIQLGAKVNGKRQVHVALDNTHLASVRTGWSLVRIKNRQYPIGITGKLEGCEGDEVLVRFEVDKGFWSRCHRFPKGDMMELMVRHTSSRGIYSLTNRAPLSTEELFDAFLSGRKITILDADSKRDITGRVLLNTLATVERRGLIRVKVQDLIGLVKQWAINAVGDQHG